MTKENIESKDRSTLGQSSQEPVSSESVRSTSPKHLRGFGPEVKLLQGEVESLRRNLFSLADPTTQPDLLRQLAQHEAKLSELEHQNDPSTRMPEKDAVNSVTFGSFLGPHTTKIRVKPIFVPGKILIPFFPLIELYGFWPAEVCFVELLTILENMGATRPGNSVVALRGAWMVRVGAFATCYVCR